MSILTPSGKKKGRPFSSLTRLCNEGHRISGFTAWRLNAPEVKKPYGNARNHHYKYALSKIKIRFGNRDGIWLRQEDGSDKFYQRTWTMPFLALVWVGQRFETHNTLHFLKQHLGLNVAHNFGLHLLEWGIFNHWNEVKKYLMNTQKIDLDAHFTRHDKNTQFLEGVRDTEGVELKYRLEAASGVERGLGRIISIVAEIEKKQQGEAEANATKNLFSEKFDKLIEANEKSSSS